MILVCDNCKKAFATDLSENENLNELDTCPSCDYGMLYDEEDLILDEIENEY